MVLDKLDDVRKATCSQFTLIIQLFKAVVLNLFDTKAPYCPQQYLKAPQLLYLFKDPTFLANEFLWIFQSYLIIILGITQKNYIHLKNAPWCL